jgi:hypothetical protein
MNCQQVRKKLNEADWRVDVYGQDHELTDHLISCPACAILVNAEQTLQRDMQSWQRATPDKKLSAQTVRHKAESSFRPLSGFPLFLSRHRLALGLTIIIMAVTALIPVKTREQVGYEISITGVDKSIATDSKGIMALLWALGMDKDKIETLVDSLEIKEVHLKVGECQETCHLSISDLKTERDVQLVIKAIIELDCCKIDKIIPIFENESTTLLGQATRKLFS